jgi:hypothetical protein
MSKSYKAEMSEEERAEWRDAISIFVSNLLIFSSSMSEQNFSDLNDLVRSVSDVRKEQINLEDEILDREVDRMLEEVVRMLNTVETERRRWEDEERKHRDRCMGFSREAKEMSTRFKLLEKRV